MDKRDYILDLLKAYIPFNEDEGKAVLQTIKFISENEKCFNSDYKLGHVTGSALVVSEDFSHVLLTHHSVLNRWFQFGGHSDGHFNTLEVAFREANEESGLKSLQPVDSQIGIFDVSVHPLPANEKMPEHQHFDIRIILRADINEPYIVTYESNDLKWMTLDEALLANPSGEFKRMIDKVRTKKRK